MKKIKLFVLAINLMILALFAISCGNSGTNTNSHEQGKEYTSAYVCPMHCDGSGAEQVGVCPACGMDYVERSAHIGDGHTH